MYYNIRVSLYTTVMLSACDFVFDVWHNHLVRAASAWIQTCAVRTRPGSRQAHWRRGSVNTARTLTPRRVRKSCWQSSPRWPWPRCPRGSPTRGDDLRRTIRSRGPREIVAAKTTTMTTTTRWKKDWTATATTTTAVTWAMTTTMT